MASMASQGFYFTRDGRLLSNQGDVIPATDEGVVYTLRFGEVTFAQGESLEAGVNEEEAKAKAAAGEEVKKKSEGATESRYLFVTASFDANLLPPAPQPPAKDAEIPSDPFQSTPKERSDKEKEAKDKYDRDKADYDRKVEDGKKRAKELTDRFAAWYYVVPGDAFRSVVLDRAALIKKKEDKSGSTSPGLPSTFEPGAFPKP
jgi:hypothetical protein